MNLSIFVVYLQLEFSLNLKISNIQLLTTPAPPTCHPLHCKKKIKKISALHNLTLFSGGIIEPNATFTRMQFIFVSSKNLSAGT